MPKVTPAQQDGAVPYGTQANENQVTFHERLMRRFGPTEWVTVKNVDDETFQWQYLPADQEDFEYTPDPMKITRRGQPEMWMIQPGETEVLIGANAYIMIDGLYKKLAAKKTIAATPDQPEGVARNFSFSDANNQEYWINKILIGKATPTFATPVAETNNANDEQTGVGAAKRVVGATNTNQA